MKRAAQTGVATIMTTQFTELIAKAIINFVATDDLYRKSSDRGHLTSLHWQIWAGCDSASGSSFGHLPSKGPHDGSPDEGKVI
jgi:hypothetical protein